MIRLYGFLRSRSNRPHWALEEIGQPYEFYQLDFGRGDARSAAYLAICPTGKVPALTDGALALFESGAICNYLGAKYPESGLTPLDDAAERARYDQWMMYVLTELEQPLWNKGKHTFALPEDKRVPAILETLPYEFTRAVSVLNDALGDREFFLGERFTMVDIFVAHTLRWAKNFEFQLEHAALEDYLTRMEARPAFERMLKSEKLPFRP